MIKIACLFPGQGSQFVGMGRDLYDKFDQAKGLFGEIDKIAHQPLSKLCFEGPAEELKRTVNTQPTILAVSLVAWQSYKLAGGPQPAYVAGHSLGEFSALYAADVLSLASTVQLVEKRAQLMESCPAGAMSAVLGIQFEELNQICAQVRSECQDDPNRSVIIANFNTREQLVISGDPASVALVSSQAKEQGGKVIPLAVGGAFHSPLMKEAASQFKQLIEQSNFADAQIPVVQNYNANPSQQAAALRHALGEQMTSSVRWCETIEYMLSQGVTHFIEIGPGKALSGMIKRIDRAAVALNIDDSRSLEETINVLDVKLASTKS